MTRKQQYGIGYNDTSGIAQNGSQNEALPH
jgi:hypothetical protein